MRKLCTLLSAVLICLSSNAQNYQWAGALSSSTGPNYSQSLASDAAGNVYVAGYFSNTVDFDPSAGTFNLSSAGSSDIFFAKYTATGALAWAKAIGGSSADQCFKIFVDASSNVYICGFYQGTVDFDPNAGITNLTNAGSSDGFFAKYTSTGTIVWAKKIGGTTTDEVRSIAVDNAGLVYITGYFGGTCDFDPGAGTQNLTTTGFADCFVAKYDANGNYTWAGKMGSTNGDYAYDITIDAAGNCYTTGIFWATADFDPGPGTANLTSSGFYDIYVAAYSPTGAYIWAGKIGGGDSDGMTKVSIDADASGTIYVAGDFETTADFDMSASTTNLVSAGFEDVFIAAYDNGGNYIYAKRIGSTSSDEVYDIDVDASGTTYITGSFSGTVDFDPGPSTSNLVSSGTQDVFVAKYDAFGNYTFAFTIGGTSSVDRGYGINTDGPNFYVTGIFDPPADFDPGPGTVNLSGVGLDDIYVAKYSNPQPLSATTSQTSPLCSGQCNGTAVVTPSGGTSPYTYLWSNGSTNDTITGLCAGTYSVTVTDALSNTTTATVTITQPTLLTLSTSGVVNATCFGSCNGGVTLTANGGTPSYSYSPTPNNLCAGSYTFTVTDANGCTTTASATITEPPQLALSESHTDNLCNGNCNGTVTLSATGGVPSYTYSGSMNSLCAGTYTYTVTDANGCSAQTTTTITEPAAITAIPSATPSTICAGGCSVLNAGTVSGGTAPYTYTWMPGNLSGNVITVCPTVTTCYTLSISDANGCNGTAMICVTVNALPSVTYVQSPTFSCINWNPITLSAGSPSGGIYSGPGVSGAQFDPAAATAGTWDIVYTYTDSNGCTDSAAQQVTVDLCTNVAEQPDENVIDVFPNPSGGYIIVSGVDDDAEVEFVDVSGKLLFTQATQAGKVVLDLTSIPNGIYFIRVRTQQGITTKKVIRME